MTSMDYEGAARFSLRLATVRADRQITHHGASGLRALHPTAPERIEFTADRAYVLPEDHATNDARLTRRIQRVPSKFIPVIGWVATESVRSMAPEYWEDRFHNDIDIEWFQDGWLVDDWGRSPYVLVLFCLHDELDLKQERERLALARSKVQSAKVGPPNWAKVAKDLGTARPDPTDILDW